MVRLGKVDLIVITIIILAVVLLSFEWRDSVNVSRKFAQIGKYEQAFEVLEKGIYNTSSPDEQRSLINAMIEISYLGDNIEDIRQINQLFVKYGGRVRPYLIEDNQTYFYYTLGQKYADAGMFYESTNLYQETLEKIPDSKRAWSMQYNIGLNYYRQDEFDKATEVFEALSKQDATEADSFTLGVQMMSSYFMQEKWQKVVEMSVVILPKASLMSENYLC